MQIGQVLVVKNPRHHQPQIQSGLVSRQGRGFIGNQAVGAVRLAVWGCGGEMKCGGAEEHG